MSSETAVVIQASTIRVLIVDDHFMARIGLAMPINQEPDMTVVAEARTAEEALELYRQHLPDVVTMDYRLPDHDGPLAVQAIRDEFPGARILMLSAFAGEEAVYQSVQSGVCGYLVKSAACSEVLNAIRTLHSGGTFFPTELADKVEARRNRPDLTPREIDILHLLAHGNTNKEIAARLGYSESLIKQELVRIFDKLGAHDRAHAATLAIERGLVELGLR
jgi:two-component system, NarL family, response regulator